MTIKQLFRNNTFNILFPPCLFTVLGVLLYIICVSVNGFSGLVLAEYLGCILACWLPALFGAIVKRPFHPFIAYGIGLVCFLGVFLQQAASIYSWWYNYDHFVQAISALIMAASLYCLYIRWKGGQMDTAGALVFIILGAAGICGIFELFEYYFDLYGVTADVQRWKVMVDNSIDASWAVRQAGGDPDAVVRAGHAMLQTIDDMSVTVLFSMMFCVAWLANMFIGDGKTFERFFSESFVFHTSETSSVEMLTGFGAEEDMLAGKGYEPQGTKFQKFIHSKNFIIWSPSIFVAIIGVICFIIRGINYGYYTWLIILQFLSSIAAGFAVPVLGIILKRQFSPSLSYVIGFFVIFGLFFERAFDIYDKFFEYDKVLHTFVGLFGAAIAFVFILRWKGDKMHPVGVMWTIMLVAVGMGVIWEIFEYITDFSGTDPQVWYDVITNSVNASCAARAAGDPNAYIIVGNCLTDTMDDIAVTIIGAGGFIIAYIISLRFNNGRAFKTIFSEQRITRYNPPADSGDYIPRTSE